jgi:hypothetical protein
MTFKERVVQSWIARSGFVRVRNKFPIRSGDGRPAHGRATGGFKQIANPAADFRASGAAQDGMAHTKL